MVVRIEHGNANSVNFYEGSHIGFHPKTQLQEGGDFFFTVIVENRNYSETIDLECEKGTKLFLMNDEGKTIDSVTL